jgi:hypothetical protein
MPNVTISAAASPRFEGDFQILPSAGYTPTAVDEALFAAVKAALNHLAQDHQADELVLPPGGSLPAPVSQGLLTARKEARKSTAASIYAEAQKFAAGQTQAEAATERVANFKQQYLASVPTFGVADRLPGRFEGEFQIVHTAGCVPDSAQATYLDSLEKAFQEFVTDQSSDSTGNYSPNVIRQRKDLRVKTVKGLRTHAEKLCTGQLSANDAADTVLLDRGGYRANRDRLTQHLFNVKIEKEVEKKKDADSWTDLNFTLIPGLPPPEDAASPEKRELFIQINKTITVIVAVYTRMDERAESGWRKMLHWPDKLAKQQARYLLGDYLGKLRGIAVIGLEDSDTSFANLALTELRNEFYTREVGRITNKYVRWLGAWAALSAAAFLVAYIVIMTRYPDWAWGQMHKAFLVAATGASIGTWASFLVRQNQFSFDELVMLEENSLDPPLRILFVVTLTMTACLLFWTGAINLEIGNLKTQQGSFSSSGSVALLIGMFAGLSERALATAISGRAAAFVKGIAAGK